MNSFSKHKDVQKFTWSARGTKSIIYYTIANQQIGKLIKDVRIYMGAEINPYHSLSIMYKTLVPSKMKNKIVRRFPQTSEKIRNITRPHY